MARSAPSVAARPRPSGALVAWRSAAAVTGAVPPGLARALGEAVGAGGARLGWPVGLVRRQAAAAANLRRAGLPGSAGDVFASYGRYWAESLALPRLGRAAILGGVRAEGLHHLDDALARGRGAVLALPHLGGWDWGGAWLAASGYATTAVVEALRPPDVFEWFAGLRRRSGMEVVPVGHGAAGAALRALAANRVVCLVADRPVPGVAAVEVPFFGRPTRLPAGPATVALRSGAPLLPCAMYFGATTGGHVALIRPPLAVARQGRFRDDVVATAAALAAQLEELIRAAPAQWHVLQPIWADAAGDPGG